MDKIILYKLTLWGTPREEFMYLNDAIYEPTIYEPSLFLSSITGYLLLHILIGSNFFKNFYHNKLNKIIIGLFLIHLLLFKILGLRMYFEENSYSETFFITCNNLDPIVVLMTLILYILPILIIFKMKLQSIEKKLKYYMRYFFMTLGSLFILIILFNEFNIKLFDYSHKNNHSTPKYTSKLNKQDLNYHLKDLNKKGFILYAKEMREILDEIFLYPLSIKNYMYQTEEMKRLAIEIDVDSIRFIQDPSFGIKEIALQKPSNIKYIYTKNNNLIKRVLGNNPFTLLEMDHLEVKEQEVLNAIDRMEKYLFYNIDTIEEGKAVIKKTNFYNYRVFNQGKQLEMVRDNKSNLGYFKNRTQTIILEAFKNHPQYFKLLHDKAKKRFTKESVLALKNRHFEYFKKKMSKEEFEVFIKPRMQKHKQELEQYKKLLMLDIE